ncbi:cuticular protein hypothetical 16 precursor [Danaus plexippus plexippus]|uniref:Cuticular protein hypothetical 16 n=1 Tax=Danaus plexippus plexippus TaxID=278856 RepID=A0A212FGG5_DANPL|nr:cuticular protein hypothetical 16 precursor [Danaus plexippus plexippus]
MNSLVVLFSVMALTAAKPSGLIQSEVISYAAPAVALAPAAVSHQSRIDIKSSPAVISEKIIAPVTRTVVAEPAIVAAPASYVAPAAYAAPAALAAPSSPAVISTVAAAPVLSAYSASVPAIYPSGFFSPAIVPSAALLKSEIKPIAVSSSQDAGEIKPELPVAPTETPEVAAARAAHLEAKALEESHQINKRSLRYLANPPIVSTYSALPVPLVSSPLYSAPIAVSSPVIGNAYRIHY